MDQIVAQSTSQLYDAFAERVALLGRNLRMRMDRRLKRHGSSFVQWNAIRHMMMEGDGLVQRDLAGAVGVEGPAMVGILDRLVAQDLVERREDSKDRRFKTVHLTPRAREFMAEAEVELHKIRAEMLAGVPAADLEAAVIVFDRVLSNMDLSSSCSSPSAKGTDGQGTDRS